MKQFKIICVLMGVVFGMSNAFAVATTDKCCPDGYTLTRTQGATTVSCVANCGPLVAASCSKGCQMNSTGTACTGPVGCTLIPVSCGDTAGSTAAQAVCKSVFPPPSPTSTNPGACQITASMIACKTCCPTVNGVKLSEINVNGATFCCNNSFDSLSTNPDKKVCCIGLENATTNAAGVVSCGGPQI